MEKMLQRNKILSILLLTVALLLSVFSYLIMTNQTITKAEEYQKAYKYEILSADDGYKLLGYYNQNSIYYVLSEQSDSVYEIFNLIEQDRAKDGVYNDVNIFFGDIVVYNENLVLNQGHYALNGKVTFANLAGNACISITNNAKVTLKEFNISTSTMATLIEANGEQTSLVLDQSTITSDYNCVKVQNGATATIKNNTQISSVNGIALSVNNASVDISASTLQTSSSSNSAILSTGSNSTIIAFSSTIKANNCDYVIENTDAKIILYGSTNIFSKKNAIKTNIYIEASYFGQSLNNCNVNIYYTGALSSHDTLIIKGFNTTSGIICDILNGGYTLRENAGSLYIAKQYRVYYIANCSGVEMPVDSAEYYDLEYFYVNYLDANVRKNYTFIGYAFNESATIPDLTCESTSQINGSDVTLYAVWEPVNYSITITGVNAGECENATEYNYNQIVAINNPVRQYYTFTHWKINGQEEVSSLTLPYKNYENITLEACFEETKYKITYNNLTDEQIQSLNLRTTYSISSASLKLNRQNYLIKGYSFYGLYDANNQDVYNAEVFFGVGQSNTISFTTGNDLILNVDIKPFYNLEGEGNKTNPFILDSSEQFYNLISGKKFTDTTTYIKIANDLVLDNGLLLENKELNNFVIDGGRKVVTINNLNSFDGKLHSILPNLNNCTIKNITFAGNVELEKSSNENINIAIISNSISNSFLSSVTNNVNLNIEYSSTNAYTSTRISGFVCDAKNSIFNNCIFGGKVVSYAQNPNKSVYLCGFSTNMSNTLIVNCTNKGILAYTQAEADNNNNTIVYISGFAVINSGNAIVNSLYSGVEQIIQKQGNQAIYSGIAVAVRPNNEIVNCVSVGSYLFGGQKAQNSQDNEIASLVWSIFAGNQIEKCVATSNYDAVFADYKVDKNYEIVLLDDEQVEKENYNFVCNQSLNNANECVARFVERVTTNDQVFSLGANYWGSSIDNYGESKVIVTIHNNINGEIKVYVFGVDNLKKIVVHDIYYGYLFEDFYSDKNYTKKVSNLSNINDNLELYAKYISYEEYTLRQSILPIVVVVVDILLLVLFIIYCERPRKVIFVKDGVELDGAFVKWGKQIDLLKDKKKYVWYKDAGAEKPISSLRMPFVFGAYRLYSFSDKQGDAIKEMHKAQENFIKKAKVQKANKQKVKKVKNNSKKSKVQQEIESSGITIVKKEVKISKKQDNK